jgi:hypothetical protein
MDESLITGIGQALNDFRSGWFLGASTLCYLLIQVLRGKVGFSVPYVTAWIEKKPKELKTYTILLFFALAGAFSAFGSDKVNVWVIVDGFLKGLALGVGANGARNVLKQGIEGAQAYKESKKTNNDQPGSDQ